MARKRRPPSMTKSEQRSRERVASDKSAIRTEITSGGTDARGTGSSAMGEVKRSSEEAQLQTCSECGFSQGRHSQFCSKKEQV